MKSLKLRFADRFRVLGAGLVVFFLVGSAAAQVQQGWVVKPEWVRAHEDFLASEALAGRGSATRDEQIAAEYVASEFLSYGLKTAPGMTSMIQSAEVIAPELDGKSSLSAGTVTLVEGTDYHLLMYSGASASGPIIRLAAADAKQTKVPRGAIVLLTDIPPHANGLMSAYQLRGSGAGLVLFEEDDTTRSLIDKNPKTRFTMHLKDDSANTPPLPAAIASVSKEAMQRMLAEKDDVASTLTVHALPSRPRKTYNAIGYLPGADSASGTILLSAHLDHLGVVSAPVNGDAIYNGANDDASGTTAVLEVAHAMVAGTKLKRSILFVCYGSEEVGGLGSQFFSKHPPVPLAQIVTNLEFEMIGSQDPKMPKGVLLLTGWERSNLGPTLHDHGALLGPDPYPEQHFFQRSDNYSLALEGVVAHTAAGWGTPPTYHQPNDDISHLDIDFMTTAIQSLVEPIRWLADSDFKPAWNPGGQPKR